MTTTALNEVRPSWPRLREWIDALPPIMAPQSSAPVQAEPPTQEFETLVVIHPGRFTFWLLSKLPVWEEITREEAAQYILQREVRVRYQPLIVEMDRKTILNEIR